VLQLVRERGSISIAELRDQLGTSRKYAQAIYLTVIRDRKAMRMPFLAEDETGIFRLLLRCNPTATLERFDMLRPARERKWLAARSMTPPRSGRAA
jgi:hypothetical protein